MVLFRVQTLSTVNCTWGSWTAWTSCSVTCGCFERTRPIDVPAANGGTNCTGDNTETEGIVMLAGGRTVGNNDVLEPQFLSINPSVPLPANLSGTKNSIGVSRRDPAMIETPGEITTYMC